MPNHPMIELAVLHAGIERTRRVSPTALCPLCTSELGPDEAVLRFRDLEVLREYVFHKSCMQLLFDATVDDGVADGTVRLLPVSLN